MPDRRLHALFPLILLASTALSTPALAQQADEAHHDEEIVVTGAPRALGDALGGVSVLSGDLLAEELKPSLGETLATQPGVSAGGAGPAASRPVLRGLGGDRVRLLVDGLGSLDVSSSSGDHAVAINPLTAERIEVLRGPAALQFGSSAIGGVVNVLDRRIPRRLPAAPISLDALVGYGSAADERSANLSVDVPLDRHWVVHGDANWSQSDDLDTGGHLLSEPLRDQARASPDPQIRALADLKGRLPNSDAKGNEMAAGLAYIDAALNAGVSVSRHTAFYGVPIRYSLDPAIEPEAPHIDVAQTRVDGRLEVPLGGFLSRAQLRAGGGRYRHFEIGDEGGIETTFRASGGEGRVDLIQSDRSGWGGVSGAQYLSKAIRVEGEEKYLPAADQRQFGLFTLQSLERGPVRIEGGGRIEFSRLTAAADTAIGNPDLERRFTTVSASLGGQYEVADGWKLSLSLSRSARAPSPDELFANGPHAGTQAFEVGDPDLDPEVGLGGEIGVKHHQGAVHLTLSAYATRFSNFLFQAPTGAIEEGLPVYAMRQGKATYRGFEAEVDAKLGSAGGIDWSIEGIADAVRARINNYGPAPLLPPLRLQAGLHAERGPVKARVEVEHAFAHRRTAPLETPTAGYTLVGAGIDWTPMSERPELTLSLAAENLFDAVARRSTSLLKDFAPIAGRDVRLTARLSY